MSILVIILESVNMGAYLVKDGALQKICYGEQKQSFEASIIALLKSAKGYSKVYSEVYLFIDKDSYGSVLTDINRISPSTTNYIFKIGECLEALKESFLYMGYSACKAYGCNRTNLPLSGNKFLEEEKKLNGKKAKVKEKILKERFCNLESECMVQTTKYIGGEFASHSFFAHDDKWLNDEGFAGKLFQGAKTVRENKVFLKRFDGVWCNPYENEILVGLKTSLTEEEYSQLELKVKKRDKEYELKGRLYQKHNNCWVLGNYPNTIVRIKLLLKEGIIVINQTELGLFE